MLNVHFRNLNFLISTRKQLIAQKHISTSLAIFPDSRRYNNSQYDTSQRNPVYNTGILHKSVCHEDTFDNKDIQCNKVATVLEFTGQIYRLEDTLTCMQSSCLKNTKLTICNASLCAQVMQTP